MFVERDRDTGAIKGVYRQMQKGYAEEELKDDDPEILAFLDPPPPRRRVPRRTIIERLDELGKLELAEIALDQAPVLIRWKWNTVGEEGVYFDDPETLAFLAAIGADPDVVLAP